VRPEVILAEAAAPPVDQRHVLHSGRGLSDFGFWVQGSGFRILDFGFRVSGFGFLVQGSEFRGSGFRFGV